MKIDIEDIRQFLESRFAYNFLSNALAAHEQDSGKVSQLKASYKKVNKTFSVEIYMDVDGKPYNIRTFYLPQESSHTDMKKAVSAALDMYTHSLVIIGIRQLVSQKSSFLSRYF